MAIGALIGFSSCNEGMEQGNGVSAPAGAIVATIAEGSGELSRTSVDGDVDAATGVLGLNWTSGDQLGVFSGSGSQILYSKANDKTEAKAKFVPHGDTVNPRYAYYPYSADNNGLEVSSLKGTIPSEQPMDAGVVHGDYKIGRPVGMGNDGYEFVFSHLFSLLRVEVDASGSALEGEKLQSVEMTLSRNERPVAVAGDFNFSAYTGAYEAGAHTGSTIRMTWSTVTPALISPVVGYVSLFPHVEMGDKMEVTVTTDRHQARFTTVARVNFRKEGLYSFPIRITDREGVEIAEIGGGVQPGPKSGTFTCATYNVDGLPSIINSGGPGASGTNTIGARISTSGWDFFGVSENFGYNDNLVSGMGGVYNQGTYRKANLGAGTADTDGLNFFWKSNVSVTGETIVQYNSSYGGITDGANTSVKKGFRHYEVTVSEGVTVDVYITHMNTYSSNGTGHINAQHSQLEQVRDYILTKLAENRRPAIFMGDTNLRYTRHKIEELLINGVEAQGYSIEDPWCEIAWQHDFTSVGGGRYPVYPGKSLMVSDATGTNADTDIILSEAEGGLQKGEVVDKVFYINHSSFKTQLKAKSYLRDVSYKKADGKALADHYPTVVEFEYTSY